MNQVAPISRLMTRHLITISPEDSLTLVDQIFKKFNFHHIPVVQINKPVGIINRFNFESYILGLSQHYESRFIKKSLLDIQKVSGIMSNKYGRIEPTDTISIALEVFRQNVVDALMVIENEELIGILTTNDIISAVSREKIYDLDYKLIEDLI